MLSVGIAVICMFLLVWGKLSESLYVCESITVHLVIYGSSTRHYYRIRIGQLLRHAAHNRLLTSIIVFAYA